MVDGQRDGLAGSELVLDAVELLHRRDGDAVDGGDDDEIINSEKIEHTGRKVR